MIRVFHFNIMSDYLQIEFKDITSEQSELLIACLTEIGFEGYEETEKGLKAFIKQADLDKEVLLQTIASLQLNFSEEIIPETNWNQVWESNFEPVIVNDFVAVRAGFHQPVKNVQYEIIITPKMSFGTGHHATTYMMIENMKKIDFTNKTVLDFGTGTGVLAILAEKLKAQKILAIDNDKWSIENAKENIEKNNCERIELSLAENAKSEDQYDIILANINRNVILDNLSLLAAGQLLNGGILFLSGLLAEDESAMVLACSEFGLTVKNKATRHNWLFLNLSKSV